MFKLVPNVLSSMKDLKTGIPQGFCLRPFLFLIYVNELPIVAPILNSILFAYDTTLSMSDVNYSFLISNLNVELNRIINWTTANILTLNISKTNSIIFSNRVIPNIQSSISLNYNIIDTVSFCKFLGVYIDNKLSFKTI